MEQLQRFCLTLELRDDPALIGQYLHWHQAENIWPEIPEGIRNAGIRNMEIYRLGTRLFMIMEAPLDFDFERDMEYLSTLPRQKEWEAFVSQFQRVAGDEKSSDKWQPMDRIFSLEKC